MGVVIRLQYSPTCPKCDELIEKLMEISARTGIEFIPELVSTALETHALADEVSRTHSEKWIKTYGTDKQKALYEKAKPLFKQLEESTIVPALIIDWEDRGKRRQLVIKGFSKENFDTAVRNLIYVFSRITSRGFR